MYVLQLILFLYRLPQPVVLALPRAGSFSNMGLALLPLAAVTGRLITDAIAVRSGSLDSMAVDPV